ATEKARARMSEGLEGLVVKNKMTRDDASTLMSRVHFHEHAVTSDVAIFNTCGLIIEAIVEQQASKEALFEQLDQALPTSAILATNTSSLSVTGLGGRRKNSGHFLGLHFFN